MKILVTGFEPFNNSKYNPSMEIIKHLVAPKRTTLLKEVLPVEFKGSSAKLREILSIHRPDVVIALGQAGNRQDITVERVAINIDNVRSSNGVSLLPDNAGDILVDEPIEKDGASAYFSTLPIWSLVNAMHQKDVPASISNTAGTFVCNHVMYTLLYEAAKHYPEMRAGFIHVPCLPEQIHEQTAASTTPVSGSDVFLTSAAASTQKFSMPLDEMIRGIQCVLDYMA